MTNPRVFEDIAKHFQTETARIDAILDTAIDPLKKAVARYVEVRRAYDLSEVRERVGLTVPTPDEMRDAITAMLDAVRGLPGGELIPATVSDAPAPTHPYDKVARVMLVGGDQRSLTWLEDTLRKAAPGMPYNTQLYVTGALNEPGPGAIIALDLSAAADAHYALHAAASGSDLVTVPEPSTEHVGAALRSINARHGQPIDYSDVYVSLTAVSGPLRIVCDDNPLYRAALAKILPDMTIEWAQAKDPHEPLSRKHLGVVLLDVTGGLRQHYRDEANALGVLCHEAPATPAAILAMLARLESIA